MNRGFDAYRDAFEAIHMDRLEGVLELRLHTDSGPLRWSHDHAFADAFRAVAADSENRIVIVTGTGDEFSGPPASPATFPEVSDPAAWDVLHRRAMELAMSLLDIPVPVIGCLNGPAYRHAELALLGDVVLAASNATIQDSAHFPNRMTPGDSLNLLLPLLIGTTRARYMMLTGQVLTAHEAKEIGLVNEVLEPAALLPRARELAQKIAQQNPLVLRSTRLLFTHRLKQAIHELLGYGLALEGLAVLDESAARQTSLR